MQRTREVNSKTRRCTRHDGNSSIQSKDRKGIGHSWVVGSHWVRLDPPPRFDRGLLPGSDTGTLLCQHDDMAHDPTGSVARPIVFVHGAWHAGWCFAALQAELDRRRVPSYAIDLPGHGLNVEPAGNLHDDADCVLRTLKSLKTRGVRDVVLVGHSYGGAVIGRAAGLCDGDDYPIISHVVFLAAFALRADESVMSALTSFPPHRVELADAMLPEGTASTRLDPDKAISALYGDCDPLAAQAAVTRLDPQHLVTMTQSVEVSPLGDIDSTYVVCTRDRAVHPEHQRLMASRCDHTVVLDTDHSPFLSMPSHTADVLAGIASSR